MKNIIFIVAGMLALPAYSQTTNKLDSLHPGNKTDSIDFKDKPGNQENSSKIKYKSRTLRDTLQIDDRDPKQPSNIRKEASEKH